MLKEYLNKPVIVDTKSDYIYLGQLEQENSDYLVLKDVDVHDHSISKISKELYIIEAAKYGIKANRKRVRLMCKDVISLSLLEDIIQF